MIYPTMKSGDLLSRLVSLGCEEVRRSGSHRTMRFRAQPLFTFGFHDGDTVASGLVRKILERDMGLTPEEVEACLGGKKSRA